MTIFDYVRQIIGQAPSGFGFLEYIFGFVLLSFMLFVLYKVFEAFISMFR